VKTRKCLARPKYGGRTDETCAELGLPRPAAHAAEATEKQPASDHQSMYDKGDKREGRINHRASYAFYAVASHVAFQPRGTQPTARVVAGGVLLVLKLLLEVPSWFSTLPEGSVSNSRAQLDHAKGEASMPAR